LEQSFPYFFTGVTFKGMMIYYHFLPDEQKQVAVNPTPKETGIHRLKGRTALKSEIWRPFSVDRVKNE
jgi:hypothetical protein